MYRAPYAEALQFRCILCTMTIKWNEKKKKNCLANLLEVGKSNSGVINEGNQYIEQL